jgi:hypothetical protein
MSFPLRALGRRTFATSGALRNNGAAAAAAPTKRPVGAFRGGYLSHPRTTTTTEKLTSLAM